MPFLPRCSHMINIICAAGRNHLQFKIINREQTLKKKEEKNMLSFYRRRKMFTCVVMAVFCAASLPGVTVHASDQNAEVIAQGERLVHNMDCNTCHTPKAFTPEGPRLDMARLLSGHPSDERVPAVPEGQISPTGWGGLFNNNLTAWAGPWGVSFGSNLTPDQKTGIGLWTEEIFVSVMRTGTHVGSARHLLPPMPVYNRLTDGELHAIYSYLRSINPVNNKVPEALPPAQPRMAGSEK
jgi:mono/diheme cytochrome c family protein